MFQGAKIPRAAVVENTTDPAHCASVQSLDNVIVSPSNRGIQHVIVALAGVPLPPDYRSPASTLRLDNRDCRFQPRVAVLTTGSRLEAVNSDPIFHSVHLYGLREINLALPPHSAQTVKSFPRPETIIVKCDIHGWMQAYIRVDRHPFHATTGADGRFRIEGVPPGAYTLETWHEVFGAQQSAITVTPDEVSRPTIVYRSPDKPSTGKE